MTKELIQNLQRCGADRLFKGHNLLDVPFNQKKILKIFKLIKEAKFICTVVGSFNYKEKKEEKENPSSGSSDSTLKTKLRGTDLSKKYKLDRLLNKRLLTYGFLGLVRADTLNDVIDLDYLDADHKFTYGYIDLEDEYSKAVLPKMEYIKSKLTLSEASRKKLLEKPEGKIEFVYNYPTTVVKKNTKYSQPSLMLIVEFSLKVYSKSLNIDLKILKAVFLKRLSFFNADLRIYKSNIKIIAKESEGKLIFIIDSMLDNLKPIFEILVDKIFQTPLVSEKENNYALEDVFADLNSNLPIYKLGLKAFKDWLYSDVNFSKVETKDYLRNVRERMLDTIFMNFEDSNHWKITRLYCEGHVDS